MKIPEFSILTASLNKASTLKMTMDSVACQTFRSLEHIVIDGGSHDHTLQLLRDYHKTYNLSWISEPDTGIADALNKGLTKSTGRYILVLQADDSLAEETTLQDVYSLISARHYDIYSFPVIWNHPHGRTVELRPIRFLWYNRFKFIFLHQGAFVHRNVFDRVGPFRTDFKICMDYDFFYRALNNGASVRFGRMPVAVKHGIGIGSDFSYLKMRLEEERRVHAFNERNVLWRTTQEVFSMLYRKYKPTIAQRGASAS